MKIRLKNRTTNDFEVFFYPFLVCKVERLILQIFVISYFCVIYNFRNFYVFSGSLKLLYKKYVSTVIACRPSSAAIAGDNYFCGKSERGDLLMSLTQEILRALEQRVSVSHTATVATDDDSRNI